MNKFFTLCMTMTLGLNLASQVDFVPLKDLETFRSNLKKKSLAASSLTVDFVQEKQFSFLTEPTIASGQIKVLHPDKFRWELYNPYNFVMVINEDRMSINEDGSESQINLKHNRMFEQLQSIIQDLVSGKFGENEDFKSSYFENDNYYKISLIPMKKRLAQYIDNIDVLLHKESLLLFSFILTESSGDSTKIEFKNHRLNVPLNESDFTLH